MWLMKIRTSAGKEYPLQFKDLSDASRFFDWLLNQSKHRFEPHMEENPSMNEPILVGNTALLLHGRPVSVGQLAGARNLKVILLSGN